MQDTKNNHRLQGHLLGAFSVLVWGTTFVATKVLLRTFSPIEIMVARFAFGFLALLVAGRGLMRPKEKWHEVLFAAAGLSGVTLYFLMENIALTYISASLVGVIVAAAPLFTALIAAAVLKEKLSRWFFLGFVCAMAGVALVSLAGVSELHFSPTGALLTIGAALVWADLPHFRLRPVVPAHPGRNRGPACGNCGVGHAGASRKPAVSRPACERDLLCDMEPRGLSSGAGAHERLHLCLARYHHHRVRARPARNHDAGDVARHGACARRSDAEREKAEEGRKNVKRYSGCAIVGGATGVF